MAAVQFGEQLMEGRGMVKSVHANARTDIYCNFAVKFIVTLVTKSLA